MFENIEKALTIMLSTIGVKLDGEMKKEKRSVWMKPWLKAQSKTQFFFTVTFQRFYKTFQ